MMFDFIRIRSSRKENERYEYKRHSILDEYSDSKSESLIPIVQIGTDRKDDTVIKRMIKSKSDYFEEGVRFAAEDKLKVISNIRTSNMNVCNFYSDLIREKSELIEELTECAKKLKEANQEKRELFKICIEFGSIFSDDIQKYKECLDNKMAKEGEENGSF